MFTRSKRDGHTHGHTHTHTDGTTAALQYPLRNALRGDNKNKKISQLCIPSMKPGWWQWLGLGSTCCLGYQTWSTTVGRGRRLTEHRRSACPCWVRTCGTRRWHSCRRWPHYPDWVAAPSVHECAVPRLQCTCSILGTERFSIRYIYFCINLSTKTTMVKLILN